MVGVGDLKLAKVGGGENETEQIASGRDRLGSMKLGKRWSAVPL